MLLITDTNVIASAAIARGHTLDLIFSDRLHLIAPEFTKTELLEHIEEISKKSKLSPAELGKILDSIFRQVEVVSKDDYAEYKNEALAITPDKNDWPFFALALKEKCAIWSNDGPLKKQAQVTIINTAELTRLLA